MTKATPCRLAVLLLGLLTMPVGAPARAQNLIHPTLSGGGYSSSGVTFVLGEASAGAVSGGGVTLTPGAVPCWEYAAGGGDCPADINGDGAVDLGDLSIVLAHFGQSGGATYEDGDINGDGNVDLEDLSLVLVDFGEPCP